MKVISKKASFYIQSLLQICITINTWAKAELSLKFKSIDSLTDNLSIYPTSSLLLLVRILVLPCVRHPANFFTFRDLFTIPSEL